VSVIGLKKDADVGSEEKALTGDGVAVSSPYRERVSRICIANGSLEAITFGWDKL
jgi:hypothetical protein